MRLLWRRQGGCEARVQGPAGKNEICLHRVWTSSPGKMASLSAVLRQLSPTKTYLGCHTGENCQLVWLIRGLFLCLYWTSIAFLALRADLANDRIKGDYRANLEAPRSPVNRGDKAGRLSGKV